MPDSDETSVRSLAEDLAQLKRDNALLRARVVELEAAVASGDAPDECRAFLDNTTDLVTVVDAAGRFTYVNAACEGAFGHPRHDLLGRLAFDFVHPEDKEATQQAFAGWLRDRVRVASFENRQVSADGRVGSFLWTILLHYDADGAPARFWSIARDMTARRRVESELALSERRYRALAEAAPDMVFVVERDGRLSYLNSAAAGALGAPPAQLLGRALDELFPPAVAETQRRAVEGVLASGRPHSEVRPIPLGGNLRELDTTLVPLFDDAGAPSAVMGVARDVTDRKQLQSDLQSAVAELTGQIGLTDTIVDSTPGVFYIIDFEGRFYRWNESLESVTGLSHDEMARANALDLFDGEHRANIADGIRRVAETGQASVEAALLHVSGHATPHLFTGRKIEIGGEARLVGVGLDLSERLRQERALHARMRELNCLYAVSAAISSIDSEAGLMRRLVEVIPEGMHCPAAARARITIGAEVFGFDPGAGDAWPCVAVDIRSGGSTAKGRIEVYSLQAPPGSDADPFDPEERALLGTLAQLVAEAIERRATRARFQRLVERAPLPLAIVDAQEAITYVNDRFTETFGYTREDVPNLAAWWAAAYPDETYRAWVLEAWNAAVAEAVAAGTDIGANEYRVTCKDGAIRTMEISGVVIGDAFLATFTDQTARRNAEDVLRDHRDELERLVEERTAALKDRTRELELSNRELEAFAYSVSHDLRAPLRAIAGFSHALLEDYHDKLDKDGKDFLERSAAAARRMGHLIDALLTLSRVSRSEVRAVELDLAALVRDIDRDFREASPERDVVLAIPETLTVVGDRGLLEQVLRNLMDNAWKYTAGTAHVRIEVGETERDGERILFVKDNGAGFDMRYSDKLFAPFQRLHKDSEFQGTGIGLSIVQRIVRMHGGTIWAESSPGQGATFFFTLRARAAAEPGPEI